MDPHFWILTYWKDIHVYISLHSPQKAPLHVVRSSVAGHEGPAPLQGSESRRTYLRDRATEGTSCQTEFHHSISETPNTGFEAYSLIMPQEKAVKL